MGDTKEMTRDQELLEEFKVGQDKDAPSAMAQRIATLESELAHIGDALALATKDAGELRDQLEVANAERADAEQRASAAEADEKKATAQVKKLTTPAKPRKLGRMAEGKSVSGEDLRDMLDDADEVEIAFSDGEREVAGLAPVAVSGDAWKAHSFGLLLTKSVDIEGPEKDTSTTIAGYALLIDGKQVAYRERSMPLQVAPQQKVTITDDIMF